MGAIEKEYNLDNGGGLTYSLTAGETYYIEVEQYRGVGVYTLNIGPKKQIMDITNDMAVSDSIQYTAQENDYLYVAETDGVYRLQFSDVQEGNGLRLEVFNSGWEIIRQEYNFGNGDGMNLSLSKGERYFIRVAQHRGLSKYTLTVEPQQE